MKVRIGVAAGIGATDDAHGFLRLVDALDDLGYDSIWVPDVITAKVFDPVAALSVAAGRRERLKLGTHLICLLYTSPSPRDATLSRMPSSA